MLVDIILFVSRDGIEMMLDPAKRGPGLGSLDWSGRGGMSAEPSDFESYKRTSPEVNQWRSSKPPMDL